MIEVFSNFESSVCASDISVIIPVRVSDKNDWVINRLFNFNEIPWRKFGEIRIVDYGSEDFYSTKISNICEKLGYIYQRESSDLEVFSLSAARNLGAQKCFLDYIIFADVDIIVRETFPELIVNMANFLDIGARKYRFITSPVIYLSKTATDDVISHLKKSNSKEIEKLLQESMLQARCKTISDKVEFQAPASSVQLFNRLQYLSMGGQPSNQTQHGGEDFDYVLRSLIKYREFPIPQNIKIIGNSWDNKNYNSARSLIEIPGLLSQSIGLCVFHLHHQKISGWSQHVDTSQKWNWLINNIELYTKNTYKYKALPNKSSDKKICIFIDDTSYLYQCIRELLPFLGNCVTFPSKFASDIVTFKAVMMESNAKAAIVTNPYATKARQTTFELASKEFEVKVFERGALPDSWFVDHDMPWHSGSYSEKYWENELDTKNRRSVISYLHTLQRGAITLENNARRIGAQKAQEILSIPQGTKIIFVPLQTPHDTSVGEHTKLTNNYSEFINEIDDYAYEINKLGWKIVVKIHPLDTSKYDFKYCIVAPSDMNIHDLIDLSAGVLCYNSGVGLLAIAHHRPVCCVGKSFYIHNKIGTYFNGDISEVLNYFSKESPVDKEQVVKFFHYLLHSFYSFGRARKSVEFRRDMKVSVTESVEYYRVKTFSGTCNKVISLDAMRGDEKLFNIFDKITLNSTKNGQCSLELDPVESSPYPKQSIETVPSTSKTALVEVPIDQNGKSLRLVRGFGFPKYDGKLLKYIWCLSGECKFVLSSSNIKENLNLNICLEVWLPNNKLYFYQEGKLLNSTVSGWRKKRNIQILDVKTNIPVSVRTLRGRASKRRNEDRFFYWKIESLS